MCSALDRRLRRPGITLQAPDLVRRLVLVGTGPRGGQNMATLTPEAQQIFGATYKVPEEIWLKVHSPARKPARPPAANS